MEKNDAVNLKSKGLYRLNHLIPTTVQNELRKRRVNRHGKEGFGLVNNCKE